MQFRHLRRVCGGFIGSKIRRNQYLKPQEPGGRKSTCKKTHTGEEGRRFFSECLKENAREEDPVPDRRF
ncbi:MAG: hypothetical protein DMG78_07755 [Acidobacteria bacterium]|nr:MAG: hypothetical protein DMG78_07755 [Acidobacteriota bacterium]